MINFTNEAALEALVTAQSALFYAEGTAGEAQAENRMFGAAIEAGMPHNTDDMAGWVAVTVGAWLTSGPMIDDCDDDCDYVGRNEYGQWEYVA